MLKKVNQKNVTGSAKMAVSAIGGGMLSNGVVSVIPSKTEKYKMIVRGVLAAAGIVGAASVKTKSKNGIELQSFFAGMSIAQALTLIRDWGAEMSNIKQGSEKATDKFIAGVFGLGCGNCNKDYHQPGNPYMALNMPSLDLNAITRRNYGLDTDEEVTPSSFE